MANDLKKLTEKQLQKLKSDIDAELKTRGDKRRTDARKAAEQAARKHGFSLNDLVGAAPKKAKAKAASAPKYRNLDNAAQTWSGRGRQPEWFKKAIAAGKTPDDMAI